MSSHEILGKWIFLFLVIFGVFGGHFRSNRNFVILVTFDLTFDPLDDVIAKS